MLSATYQRASVIPRSQLARDPDNRWLGRFTAHRLEAEAIRDAMIFVTGRLDLEPGGPAGADLSAARRSLYIQTARWDRGNFATLFDAANPDASVEKRTVSTVTPQALLMLNNDFVRAQAKHLARRVLHEAPDDEYARIDWTYHLLFGRPVRAEESEIIHTLLAKSTELKVESAWRDVVHVLLCSNEFIYVD